MPTLRFSRLSLGVSDVAVSEAFYRDVLGLDTVRAGDEVHVRLPDFSLVLETSPPPDRAKFHVGFQVERSEDVDAWAARLREHGMEIMSGPFEEEGVRRLFFVDPDNYELEIFFANA